MSKIKNKTRICICIKFILQSDFKRGVLEYLNMTWDELPHDLVEMILNFRKEIMKQERAATIIQRRTRLFQFFVRVCSCCGPGCGHCYACVSGSYHPCSKPWRRHIMDEKHNIINDLILRYEFDELGELYMFLT